MGRPFAGVTAALLAAGACLEGEQPEKRRVEDKVEDEVEARGRERALCVGRVRSSSIALLAAIVVSSGRTQRTESSWVVLRVLVEEGSKSGDECIT